MATATDKRRLPFGSTSMAFMSGLLGATASCFAKFAFDPNSPVAAQTRRFFYFFCDDPAVPADKGLDLCFVVELAARGLCLVGMIACNAYMLGTFLKGMEDSGSVAGTAMSTASNFIASAFYGYMLWNERFSLLWWTGFTMVVAGVMLLSTTTLKAENRRRKRD